MGKQNDSLMQNNKSYSSYTSEVMFDMNGIKNPQGIFEPIYSWVWNSPINKLTIKEQLDRMKRIGIKAMYIIPEPPEFRPTGMITKMTPSYLSDEFFKMVQYAVEYAKNLNMIIWLYDEGGWPSGGACGQVIQNNPDCMSEVITESTVSLKCGDTYFLSPTVLSAFTEDYKQITSEYTAENDCVILEYKLSKRPGHLPCLLKKKAVDKFIELTHERYHQFLGDTFGISTYAFFTDEAILTYPYTVLDPSDFKQQTGFAFESYLPTIFHKNAFGEKGELFRIAYFHYTSKMFCQTYMMALKKWCNEHNMLLAGHMDGDHLLNDYRRNVGNILEQLRYMDIPGVDVIVNQIYPGDGQDRLFPRMASSAANQTGKYRTLTESFAVYGSGLTFQIMRYVIGAQAVRGINIMNIMSMSSGSEDGFLCHQFRPNFMLLTPMTKFLPEFNRYLSRISYMASIGKPQRKAAVYLPIRDIWSEHPDSKAVINSFYSIGEFLDKSLIDFDVIDDNYILSSDIENGNLCGGNAEYSHIYIPDCKYILQNTKSKLKDFIQSGGYIYSATNALFPEIHHLGENVSMQTSIRSLGNHNGLRASVRKDANGTTIYMLYNEDTKDFNGTVEIDLDSNINYYKLDLTKATLYGSSNKLNLRICCGEVICVIATKEEYPIDDDSLTLSKKLLHEIYEFDGAVCEQFLINSDLVPFLNNNYKSLGKITVGEWEKYVGKDFSGGIEYKCNFNLNNVETDITLELGDVSYCCEITINNSFKTQLLAYPYHTLVPAKHLHCGANELIITVYNTAANEYISHNYSDIPDAVKGTYHNRTLEYEKNSLLGGLLSPVKIYKLI